jgi:hypothetical protein
MQEVSDDFLLNMAEVCAGLIGIFAIALSVFDLARADRA